LLPHNIPKICLQFQTLRNIPPHLHNLNITNFTNFNNITNITMSTYLIHGFRWPRPLIRIHILLQNLDDAAAEWLMAPATTAALTTNFRTLHGDAMKHLPNLKFIEQYDPLDESSDMRSQPYAYVADVVHEVKLGIDIDDVRGKGVSNESWGAIVDLRDAIAPGEKVAWFVVVCGDTERYVPPTAKVMGSSGAYYRSQHENSHTNWRGTSHGHSHESEAFGGVDEVCTFSVVGQSLRLRVIEEEV
jgi:hypothetical protein